MAAPSKGFRNYENFLTVTIFLVFGLVFLDRMAITFIFPFVSKDLGLSNTKLGIIVAIMAICFAFSSLIFSSLSDFLGRKKVILLIFIFIFSLATFTSGIVSSFGMLLLVRALMAAAEGPVIPLVQSTLLSESSG